MPPSFLPSFLAFLLLFLACSADPPAAMDASISHDAAQGDSDRLNDSGGSDAASDDAGNDAGSMSTSLTVEIVNTLAEPVHLDGTFNRDCDPPYYTLSLEASGAPLLDRPTFLSCRCDRCDSSGCMGLADAGVSFLTIPPGGSVRVPWDHRLFTPADGCARGCLAGNPAAAGSYRVRVEYRAGEMACPSGEPSRSELSPPPGDGELFTCPFTDVRCIRGEGVLDRSKEAIFTLGAETVRIELD